MSPPPGRPKVERILFVAHPDDETLFFSSILFRYRRSLHVVCVTDGNGDGEKALRQAQFRTAMKRFGVASFEFLDEPDHYETRLSIAKIIENIRAMRPGGGTGRPQLKAVYTHGPLGEYGHPHHQDVSRAVHESFFRKCPVCSPSYNLDPDFIYKLTKQQFALKREILTEVYSSETRRFLNLVPVTSWEGFVQMKLSEVKTLHGFFAGSAPLNRKMMPRSRWLINVLPEIRERMKKRIF